MSKTVVEHLSEEQLVEIALQENQNVCVHLLECEKCADFVGEIRYVKESVESISEVEPPVSVREKILSIPEKKSSFSALYNLVCNWYRNPFLIGIVTIMAVLLLYAVFEVFFEMP